MAGLSPASRFVVLIVAAVALVACTDSSSSPTNPAPTPTPPRFLVIHLTPSDGTLHWRLQADRRSVTLTPSLTWEAQFLSPLANRTAYVGVRLLNADRSAVCFESVSEIRDLRLGFLYVARSSVFTLADNTVRPANPCGDDFAVGTVEVSIRTARYGTQFETFSFPCDFHFIDEPS